MNSQTPTQLVVLSGKGGTGKTTLTASFAALAGHAVLADCDVDASDLSLVLDPTVVAGHEFTASNAPTVDDEQCILCGQCEEVCRFDALHVQGSRLVFDEVSCEGCGVCSLACPVAAIRMEPVVSGQWFESATDYGPLFHAQLEPAGENSGKLVTRVRNEALERARKDKTDLVIIDGPPGIGCAVIASLSGVSMALLATEPTQSGLHDLERVLRVCRHFGVTTGVCINRWDLNEEMSASIEEFCRDNDVEVVGRIPFDRDVVEALVRGRPVVSYSDGPAAHSIRKIWATLNSIDTSEASVGG